jgi:6-phosphogluconolactonase
MDTSRVIKVVPDGAALAAGGARRVVEAAQQAITAHGAFSLVLSGGSTPKALYQQLAAPPLAGQVAWEKVRVYWGDERCVPPDSSESNYRMAQEALLSAVPISPENIHRMQGELDPEEAAKAYGQLLKEHFGEGGPDLALLGMGDDGHTASLFPGTAALAETKHRCVANYVEKLEAWRLTMTAPFLNRSHQVMILVSGAAKAERLHEVLEGPREPQRLPIQLIQPAAGSLLWLLDGPAAAMR